MRSSHHAASEAHRAPERMVHILARFSRPLAPCVGVTPVGDELAVVPVERMLPRTLLRGAVVKVHLAGVTCVLRPVCRERCLYAVLGDP